MDQSSVLELFNVATLLLSFRSFEHVAPGDIMELRHRFLKFGHLTYRLLLCLLCTVGCPVDQVDWQAQLPSIGHHGRQDLICFTGGRAVSQKNHRNMFIPVFLIEMNIFAEDFFRSIQPLFLSVTLGMISGCTGLFNAQTITQPLH